MSDFNPFKQFVSDFNPFKQFVSDFNPIYVIITNSADSDERSHFVASHLSLHFLLWFHL